MSALKILFCFLGAVVAWDVFVIIVASWYPPLLWIVNRPHYEIAFSIQFPDGVRTAKSVIEAVYFDEPWWDDTIPPIEHTFGLGMPIRGRQLIGEAVTMCLPDNKAISMMPNDQIEVIPKAGTYTGGDYYRRNIFAISDALLTQEHPNAFVKDSLGGQRISEISAFSVDAVSAARMIIPSGRLPTMVFFENAANARSAHVFNPESAEQWLGPGVKFLSATIGTTNAPIQSDSEKCLSWLKDCAWREANLLPDAPDRVKPNDDDPIVIETNNRGIGSVWCQFFTYRSHI